MYVWWSPILVEVRHWPWGSMSMYAYSRKLVQNTHKHRIRIIHSFPFTAAFLMPTVNMSGLHGDCQLAVYVYIAFKSMETVEDFVGKSSQETCHWRRCNARWNEWTEERTRKRGLRLEWVGQVSMRTEAMFMTILLSMCWDRRFLAFFWKIPIAPLWNAPVFYDLCIQWDALPNLFSGVHHTTTEQQVITIRTSNQRSSFLFPFLGMAATS